MSEEYKIAPINHIEVIPEIGKPRIAGQGVKVEFLKWFIDDPEWTVEQICEAFDLTPGQVYAAWSYYSDHKDEIETYIAEREAHLEKLRAQYPDTDKRRDELIHHYEERTGRSWREQSKDKIVEIK